MLQKRWEVVWVDQGTPIADRDLQSLLRKAIDGGEPRRKMHTLRGDIFPRRLYLYCEPSDQRSFCGKLKLSVAVGERLFHLPAFGDINVDADQPLRAIIAVIKD